MQDGEGAVPDTLFVPHALAKAEYHLSISQARDGVPNLIKMLDEVL